MSESTAILKRLEEVVPAIDVKFRQPGTVNWPGSWKAEVIPARKSQRQLKAFGNSPDEAVLNLGKLLKMKEAAC